MPDERPRPRRNFFDEVAYWLSQRGDESGRSWGNRLAEGFALLGAVFAALQLLFATLDLANRTVLLLRQWFPYLVPLTLAIGAVYALYLLIRAEERRQRGWAGGTLGLILVVAGVWGGWSYYEATRPPKAVLILVADFDGREVTRKVDWGRRIYEQVTAQVKQAALGERVAVERYLGAFSDSGEARARGEARRATIVLWGWYDDFGVSPHFELLRQARTIEPTLPAPPKDLLDFDVYLRSGPQEMAYIVAVVLGLIQYSDHDYAAAESLFTLALNSAPPEADLLGLEVPLFYRASAHLLSQTGAYHDLDAVVADLQRAIARKPTFWQAHWNLALTYTVYCTPTLALDAALAEAQKVEELRPDHPDPYWLLGQIHARRREWAEAETAYQEALRLDPEHVEAQEALAKVLWDQGKQEAAQAAYQRALEIRQRAGQPKAPAAASDDPLAERALLGYAYLNAGQYDRAIAIFEEVLDQRPDHADFHRYLGNAYYWQGRAAGASGGQFLDRAIAEYERARQLAPDDNLLLVQLAGAYHEAGRDEEALQAYLAAVQAQPCDDEALLLLAVQYERLGRSADANAAWERLTQLNPRWAVAWQAVAATALQREDYAAAAAAYRAGAAAVAADDPARADLTYGLATALYYLEDYVAAEAAYRQTLQLRPGDAATLAGWADSLAKLGRVDEAIAAYQEAVQREPDSYIYWVSLGALHEKKQAWQEALAAYERAAALAPDISFLHRAQGHALQTLGRYEEAIAAYERASQLDPEDAAVWEALTFAYAAVDRPDEALRAAAEALRLNPTNAAIYLVRGDIHRDRGAREEARADYQQALALAGDNAQIKQLAEAALARLGR